MSWPTEWIEIDDDRQLLKLSDTLYVIRPNDVRGHFPIFCPVCDVVMPTADDMHSFDKFQCCDWCASRWAYPNLDDWKMEWRPDRDTVATALKKRNKRSSRIQWHVK